AWTYRGKTLNRLPFDARYVSEIDRPDVEQKMAAATQFAGLGGRLDLQALGSDAGLPLDPLGQPTAEERERQMQAEQMAKARAGHRALPADKGGSTDGSEGPEPGPAPGVPEAPGQPGPAAPATTP